MTKIEKLYRAYQNKRPLTKVYRRTENEARDDIKFYSRGLENISIQSKDINHILKNRKKTGFRGIL